MHRRFTLFIALLFFSLSFAQQGINYKAIIKDDNGNVLVNTEIEVQFTILQNATNVYQESHILTTDSNGLIIINISEGNPTPSSGGTFNAIDWAADTTFLNTQVRTGFSFVDMGTTAFKAVPYAIHAETAANVSGLEAIDEGNGIGWRLKGRDPNNFGNIGINAVDLSNNTIPNSSDGATGNYSIAMGAQTTASGLAATAFGYNTTASGTNSLAMGDTTVASGQSSTTMGYMTIASGNVATAMGRSTTASSYASLAIGQYNVGGGNNNSWVASDPLFEVGFGTSPANKSNALTVTKNGRVGIGTNTPTTFLQLTNGYEATLSNTNSGYFMIGRETGPNLLFDTNEILARNNGGTANLHLQHEGGNVYVGGTLTHSSDRRLKKDITPLSYGLETILQLNPVTYNWINRTQDHKSLGLIAQEVQPIVGEIVHADDDEAKTLSVSYTELIPVLIKAIQEQQEMIESMRMEAGNQQNMIKNQNLKIEDFTAELKERDNRLNILDQRLNQFELLLKANDQ